MMSLDQHDYYHDESIFQAFDKDLKTAEEVLEQLEGEALDNGHEWESKVLEAAQEMVKQKRVNRK